MSPFNESAFKETPAPLTQRRGFNSAAFQEPASQVRGFNPERTPRATPSAAPVTAQAKPYEAPAWDRALHQGIDAVKNAAGQYFRMSAAVDPVHAMYANPAAAHVATSALEKVGSVLPETLIPSFLGAVGADLAEGKAQTGPHTSDYVQRLAHGDTVGAADEYFPTSAKELERIDNAHVPGVSQIAHQARNHPMVTGALTTLVSFKQPNFTGDLLAGTKKVAGEAVRAASPHVARAGAAVAKDWHASPLGQHPIGQAANNLVEPAKKTGQAINDSYQRHFGHPVRTLRQGMPQDPVSQEAATNQVMRYNRASRIGAHEAQSRTKAVFSPRQTAKLGMDASTPIGKGSSLPEQEAAIDYYQAREHRLRAANQPPHIQAAAVKINNAWSQAKTDPDFIDNMLIPTNPSRINHANALAMDPKKAPGYVSEKGVKSGSWIDRELNAAGITKPDEREAVLETARNQFLSQYEPDLSKMDPKAAVRVARMSYNLKHVVNETTARLKATNPELLPNEKTAYFPMRNLLEDTNDEEASAHVGGGKRAVSTPYDKQSFYGTVAQMRHAGHEPFEGLTPEDALRDDLQRKWTNIHAVNAFNTLGGMRDRWGNYVVGTQKYFDPVTQQSLDYAGARQRAKEMLTDESLRAAAAHRGDVVNAQGKPVNQPSRIPNPVSAKAEALAAMEEAKRAKKLEVKLDKQGRRFEDATAKSNAATQVPLDKLTAKTQGNVDAIKASGYLRAEGDRAALDASALQSNEALDKARARANEMLESGVPKAIAREVKQTHTQLSNAFRRVQNRERNALGSKANVQTNVLKKRGSRVINDVKKLGDRLSNIRVYATDASAAERKRLNNLAGKYKIQANDRVNKLVTRYFVSAYDDARRNDLLKLAKTLHAHFNTSEGGEAVSRMVENSFMKKDANYVNGAVLKAAGINIPGIDADARMSKDAANYFMQQQMPKEAQDASSLWMKSMNDFGRMGVVYNPIVHGVFNLGATYLGRTRDIVGLAKAMPMLLGTMVGHEGLFKAWEASKASTIQQMRIENAWQPGGFSEQLPYFTARAEERDASGAITGYKTAAKGSTTYSAMRRSVTRNSELSRFQQARKVLDSMMEYNSRVVFDRFEKWYAANLFEHQAKKLGSTALAARATRDAMGTDLLTPFEQKLASNAFWFYPWFKTIAKFAVATGIHDPSWWNAPLQGARVEREGEGDGEIRTGNNPYMLISHHKKQVKDAQTGAESTVNDGYDTMTLPLPQRILNGIVQLATGSPDRRDHSINRFSPAFSTLSGHLNPVAGTAFDFASEVASNAKTPDYLQPVDPNASLPEMATGGSANLLGKFLYPIQQVNDSVHDLATNPGGVGAVAGNMAKSALGINHGYRLQGDDIGGPAEGSEAQDFYKARKRIEDNIDKYQPGRQYADADKYAQAQNDLKALLNQYPMMRK